MRIVWSSFDGRYSDSPRVLFEAVRGRADLDHTWLAAPLHEGRFPRGVATVDPLSRAGRAALESADLVVASSHIEVTWDKPPESTYLQTWHGTPLKRVHRDLLWAPPGRIDWLEEDVARWDALLSPNAPSTSLLRQAFRFEGEIWETGYPRNDLLASPAEADGVRRQVRERLGVPEEATVVLYAPTWRDDEVQADEPQPIRLALDPATFSAGLGEDHVLLVRAHSMVRELWRLEGSERVHDVSHEADVRDLMAAADVLVTDYSSLMFDFVITGRPLVFFAFDLDDYASRIRGLYFDLRPEAPGPVVTTTEEVLDAVRRLPQLREEYADRYAAFRDRYTSWEDGHSTTRVLDRLGLR